jgi:hypothetical protein
MRNIEKRIILTLDQATSGLKQIWKDFNNGEIKTKEERVGRTEKELKRIKRKNPEIFKKITEEDRNGESTLFKITKEFSTTIKPR